LGLSLPPGVCFGQLAIRGTIKGRQQNLPSVTMDDIVYTNNERRRSYSLENNLDLYFNYDWHNQFIRLSYTRNLGNSKLRSIRWKSGSEEERKRDEVIGKEEKQRFEQKIDNQLGEAA
jgi:hypothetical protein